MVKKTDTVYESVYNSFKRNPARDTKSRIERMYIRLLTELAISRFKWNNLPQEIDARFLELTLYYHGLCVFYHDNEFERYFALRASGQGVNHYDNPVRFTVIGSNFLSKTIDGNACVPIWANHLRMPDSDIAFVYAARLGELDRTVDINSLTMRTPTLITCDESERLSMANVFRQVKEGMPVIYGTSALSQTLGEKVGKYDLTSTNSDRQLLALQAIKHDIWNECMTFLGFNNSNQEKKERMITDEVTANESQISGYRNIALAPRMLAAERINDLYGLDVSVEWAAPDATGTGGIGDSVPVPGLSLGMGGE